MSDPKYVPMSVTLVDSMGSDLTVVNAARVSFDKQSDLIDGVMLRDKDVKLINYLARHNHWSPFAHTSIQLRVKAPIFVARQLAKSQVGGVWNEVSRRYVDAPPEFWLPDILRQRPDASIKQGSSLEPVQHNESCRDMVKWLVGQALGAYEDMVRTSVAPEQARMVLPQNTMTEWYWTGSLMFFARVCKQRLAPGAQLETREIAEQIAEIVATLFPVSWSALMEIDHD